MIGLGLAGATMGAGLLLVGVWCLRGGQLTAYQRVVPFVRDLPTAPARPTPRTTGLGSVWAGWRQRLADLLDGVLGGRASIQRRLDRLGSTKTVDEFRLEQVSVGLATFVVGAVLALLLAADQPSKSPALIILVGVASFLAVSLQENRLTAQVRAREAKILLEFPVIAELLALAVAAGEGPVAAMERVTTRAHGELARDLQRLLGHIRTGTPVAQAFDEYAQLTGVRVVSRFAHAVAVAIERGTPLADVLHAQAGDVREAQRRELIENGARREVLMMLPVVFLVLPTTVVFAFYPGVIGLELVAP